jgi:hypothetical protein
MEENEAMPTSLETPARHDQSRDSKLVLGGLCLLIIASRASLLHAPILRDEGLYAYISQDLLRGYLPLTTALDNKGPFLFYQWAAALWLGGIDSIASVRCLGILVQIGCTLALYAIARELRLGERFALVSAALFVFHTHLIKLCSFYNGSEFYALLPALLGVLFLLRGRASGGLAPSLLAGIFFGLAVWTRLTVATWGALALLLLWPMRRRGVAQLALLLAGGLGVSLLFLGLYAYHGHLTTLQESFFLFPSIQLYTSDAFIPEGEQLWSVVETFLPNSVVLWLPALMVLLRPAPLKQHKALILGWSAMALLGFLVTRLYLPKQMFLVLPPICLMAAAQIDAWWSQRPRPTRVVIALLLALTAAYNAPEHWALARGDASVSDVMVTQGEKVAAWVKANTRPDDFFYNWGVEWQVYSGSVRRSPTRQVNALLLVMAAVAASNGAPVGPTLERMQQEVVDGLQAHPPEVFALTAGLKDYGLQQFYLPHHLEAMLLRDYELVFEEKPYWVFRRKLNPSAQPLSPAGGEPQ